MSLVSLQHAQLQAVASSLRNNGPSSEKCRGSPGSGYSHESPGSSSAPAVNWPGLENEDTVSM